MQPHSGPAKVQFFGDCQKLAPNPQFNQVLFHMHCILIHVIKYI